MHQNVIDEVVNNDFCIGCGICAGTCPHTALAMEFNPYGEFIPKMAKTCDESCSSCLSACPFSDRSDNEDKLNGKGILGNIIQIADPAFLLDASEPKEKNKQLEIDKNAIGLNLSPFAGIASHYKLEPWTCLASQIVLKISRETGRRIYLIPHVTNPDALDNDYLFMQNIISRLNVRDNIIALIPPVYNAAEMKWIISRMHIFAGTRMHSIIAALSSGVPTLSLAYSMKAQGLNEDIFGNQRYCLDTVDLTPDNVVERIKLLLKDHAEVRTHLEQVIPEIQKIALNAGKHLQDILQTSTGKR